MFQANLFSLISRGAFSLRGLLSVFVMVIGLAAMLFPLFLRAQPAFSEDHRSAIDPPLRLAIYYGWPSFVNNSQGDIDLAIQHFSQFDIVVFGDGLEHFSHPDHKNTATIIRRLVNQGVQVYGYVDMGVSTQNLSVSTAQQYVDAWHRMGVTGIFWDDAGFDFGVTRDRQNLLFDYTHQRGLSVFVNAWHPEDVLADYPTISHLGDGDLYLAESWMVGPRGFSRADDWRDRAQTLREYSQERGVRIAAIGMIPFNGDGVSFDQQYRLLYWGAALYSLYAVGYSDPYFGAGSSYHNQLFFPASLETAGYGSVFLEDVQELSDGKSFSRRTDAGQIVVTLDGELSMGRFSQNPKGGSPTPATSTPISVATATPMLTATPAVTMTPTPGFSPTPTASFKWGDVLSISQSLQSSRREGILLVGDDIRVQITIKNNVTERIVSLPFRYQYASDCLSHHYGVSSSFEDVYNSLTGVLEWRDLIAYRGAPLLPGESLALDIPFHVEKFCYFAQNRAILSDVATDSGNLAPSVYDTLGFRTSTPKTITGRIFIDDNGDGNRSDNEVHGISEVPITVTNQETGATYVVRSNSIGSYSLADLLPGWYVIDAPRVYDGFLLRTTKTPVDVFVNFFDDVKSVDVGYAGFSN